MFAIFNGLGSAKPSDHFTVDLEAKTVTNASDSGSALSFN